jgi:hypothetical protein
VFSEGRAEPKLRQGDKRVTDTREGKSYDVQANPSLNRVLWPPIGEGGSFVTSTWLRLAINRPRGVNPGYGIGKQMLFEMRNFWKHSFISLTCTSSWVYWFADSTGGWMLGRILNIATGWTQVKVV